jgi:hypothetical protein
VQENASELSRGNVLPNYLFEKSLIVYNFSIQTPVIKVYTFFNQKWHFDDLYNRFIVQRVISFGYHTSFRLFDAG